LVEIVEDQCIGHHASVARVIAALLGFSPDIGFRKRQMSDPTYIGHSTAIDLLQNSSPSGGTILDVGAFPGMLTRRLLNGGWRVIAIDKQPDRILHAGHEAADGTPFADTMKKLGVQTIEIDIEKTAIPLSSETADAVVLTEVIEHLYVNPLFAISELNRVLKANGRLIISTPNLLSLRNRVNFAFGRMDRIIQRPYNAFLQDLAIGHKGHVRLYSAPELQTMLEALGFETEIHFHGFYYWDRTDIQASPSAGTRRRFARSPKAYAQAGAATARVFTERLIPGCRPHIFITATKRRSVTLAQLSAPILME
jgi:SAM-dependent methyltransferase